jgi:hypothetical protein
MSDGFQFFIGEDGSQILIEANTGKRFTLLEKNYSLDNMNHQYQPYNYGYYQNVNTMPVPNSEQISYITPQSQLNLTSEGPLQQQPYKTNQQKTPQQNRT